MTRVAGAISLALAVASLASCRELGFTSRVLWRVPSPDGHVVAVCQELPEFDGPGFDIRLERPDGTLARRLYRSGDGDPCSELAWSTDGQVLAVLSDHVARLRFVDVTWALMQPANRELWWSPRQVDLGREGSLRLGKNLRFVGPREIELTTCSYSPLETQRTHQMRCTSNERRRRVTVPPLRTAAGAKIEWTPKGTRA